MRIMVAEHDRRALAKLVDVLRRNQYVVETAVNGEDAWFRGEIETYAAIILAVGLPMIDGLTLVRRWRGVGQTTPVLLLTESSNWAEGVEAIDAGADDYLNKPLVMEELLSRLRAVIRRAAGRSSSVITVGDTTLDHTQMKVSAMGATIPLSGSEFRLFSYLVHHQGRVVSKCELADSIYGSDDCSANALEALVARVRKKVGQDLIETRRGLGYIVRAESVGGNQS